MQSPQSLQSQPKWKRVIEEYRQEPTFDNVIEILFKVKKRESTVRTEVYCGFIHFLSVCTCLAINPSQLSFAGYEKETTATSTALACAVTCFLTGFFGNLPFVCTPILATSIYFSVFMKSYDVSLGSGNVVSLLVGVALMLCGIRRVINFSSRLIPDSIRVGICVGVSLLIALQALVRLNLVVQGTDTILKLGSIWEPQVTVPIQNNLTIMITFTCALFICFVQVMISILAFILIGVLHHFSVRGSYVCGLVFGSFSFWLIYNSWPKEVFAPPRLIFDMDFSSLNNLKTWELFLDIFIISSVLLAGLSSSLSSLARLEITSGIPPRRRWLYLSCGIGTIVGAAFGTGPLLISPESIPAIVAGAKTGLSTVVCGFCFIISVFMYPLWASVPEAGTGPVILMIGVLLFENTARVNWLSTKVTKTIYITFLSFFIDTAMK